MQRLYSFISPCNLHGAARFQEWGNALSEGSSRSYGQATLVTIAIYSVVIVVFGASQAVYDFI